MQLYSNGSEKYYMYVHTSTHREQKVKQMGQNLNHMLWGEGELML